MYYGILVKYLINNYNVIYELPNYKQKWVRSCHKHLNYNLNMHTEKLFVLPTSLFVVKIEFGVDGN